MPFASITYGCMALGLDKNESCLRRWLNFLTKKDTLLRYQKLRQVLPDGETEKASFRLGMNSFVKQGGAPQETHTQSSGPYQHP